MEENERERERQRLERIKELQDARAERKHKTIKENKVLLIVFLVLLFIATFLFAYFYLTQDVRMEKRFVMNINAIYQKVEQEYLKKQQDPYYEFSGISAQDRKELYSNSYNEISKLISTNIGEEYFVLEKEQLEKLGINNLEGPYLVNYEKKLVLSIVPLVLTKKTMYTSEEILENYKVDRVDDTSGANDPLILEGMNPIIYNEDIENWEITNEENWYNYDNKEWANVMLSDYNEEDTEGSIFVWIPRFAYKMSDKNYHTKKEGIVDIKFLVGNSNVAIDGTIVNPENTDCVNNYVIHPAFKFGKDITGIWVSKFEASSLEDGNTGENYGGGKDTSKTYKSVADRYSWRNTSIGMAYKICRNIVNNPIYKLNNQTADSHLIKNSEWGAVTYLTQSKYGRNSNQVWINNYTEIETDSTKTGYAGRSSNDKLYGSTNGVVFAWNTENGVKASTTGNVYGIYDLSGGCIERTASYINNGSNGLMSEGKEIYEESNLKYKDVYEVGVDDSEVQNYNSSIKMLGDAIYETSLNGISSLAWFNNYSIMPCQEYPFFYRGGNARRGDQAGIFSFSKSSGGMYSLAGFRAVLTENTN